MSPEIPQPPRFGKTLRRNAGEFGRATWHVIRDASKPPVLELWARAFIGVAGMLVSPAIGNHQVGNGVLVAGFLIALTQGGLAGVKSLRAVNGDIDRDERVF